ncbi:MAG: NAD(P)H-hydrate dehydratase [Acidobacteriota bacterium]
MRIVTVQEMSRADQRALHEWQLPTLMMMENAGLGVARCLLREAEPAPGARVLVLAGKGNNGGDALAAARHLAMAGLRVQAILLAARQRLKPDPGLMLSLAERCGVEVLECPEAASWPGFRPLIGEADLIIDGILGTGLKKPISGWLAEVVASINASPAPAFSIDIPSGLSGDRPEVPGPCVQADVTIALGLPKPALVLPPAEALAGELHVAGLGVPIEELLDSPSQLDLLEASTIRHLLPGRPPDAHKGSFGHVLALVGSRGKPGAGGLVCLAALRAGAGLVTAAVPRSAHPIVASFRPEVMVEPLAETDSGSLAWKGIDRLRELVRDKTLILAGPGLGTDPDTVQVLRALISETRLPLVLDADALNAFCGRSERLDGRGRALILTPHPGEMARLTGISSADVQSRRLEAARGLAAARSCHLVLKGYRSLIAAPDGHVDINPTGSSALATAGTGDVLSGLVAGYLAQGLAPADALRCAVYLHGLAGDIASAELGEMPVVASDVIDYLPRALRAVLHPSQDADSPPRRRSPRS